MQECKKCVLNEAYPGIHFDENGVCNYCNNYVKKEKETASLHFDSEDELRACLEKYKKTGNKYDVLVPISGGVDSSFALIKIIETFKLKPLAFHNDHGFEDDDAIVSVRKLCKAYDVDLVIMQQELGFMRKLFKYFNEARVRDLSACHVCGNILYFNALQVAERYGINLVINGYSKGQAAFIEDNDKARRLFAQMMEIIADDPEFTETFTGKFKMVEKQNKFIDRRDLEADVDIDKIMVVPFFIFKFYKTNKKDLQEFCKSRFDWQPLKSTYPARTTNCDMIWLNTHVDLKKSGYSLYQDEYSTMIRAGDFSRAQANKDLAFNPPDGLLDRLAKEIELDFDRIVSHRNHTGEIPEENSKKVLLLLLPYWSPLIPPMGMACLKGFIQREGYDVKAVDVNTADEFRELYESYFRAIKEQLPDELGGNYHIIAKDVLMNHMMAFINKKENPRYRELLKRIVRETFYFEASEALLDELHRLIKRFYTRLEEFIAGLLDREKPGILGFSVYEGTLPATLFTARLAKKRYPAVKTVMGGGIYAEQLSPGSPIWETFPEKAACIDTFLPGEGEHLFLRYLEGRLPGDGRVFTPDDTGGHTLEPADAPLPDFSDFDIQRYPYLASYTSRSCPFQCKFCSETVQWKKYRKKDALQAVGELKQLHEKYGRQLFLLCDSLLNPITSDLSNGLIEAGLSIYWDGYLRADKNVCDPENTLLWRRGGFYRARLGIESGSPRVLKLMDKKTDIPNIKSAISNLAYAGIKTTTYWVIGFPGETDDDFQQTLELIEELKNDIYSAWANPFYFFPTGQVNSPKWEKGKYTVYPEWADDLLIWRTWGVDGEPSRQTIYKRLNRFIRHCADLGIPTPYNMSDINKADERWKKLHPNAVPALADFQNKDIFIDESGKIEDVLLAENDYQEDDGDFGF